MVVGALAQGTPPTVRTDIAKLTPTTRIEWDPLPATNNIAGYWVQMQSGTNFVEFYTTNTAVTVYAINPNTPNGTHQIVVYGVNAAGLDGIASPTLTTNLWRPPGQANKPRVYTP